MLEIFQFNFMIYAFTAGIVIAVIAPVIGSFLVVRRYSLLADTLAHISLAGVAVGLLLKSNPVKTAILVSVLTAFALERLRKTKKIFSESALALFLWGGLATAVVIISIARGFNVDLFSFLFGSIIIVDISDLYLITGLGAVILIMITVFYKEFFLVSFDEELAEVNGINARIFNLILVILAALTVSLSMRIVGVLLIGALMVVPVITAMLFSRSFKHLLFFSVAIALASVISGLFLSYYLDLASGGTIVLIALVFFLAGLLSGKKG
jgi:zinc transport system permease protein